MIIWQRTYKIKDSKVTKGFEMAMWGAQYATETYGVPVRLLNNRFGNGREFHLSVELESLEALDAWQKQFNVDPIFVEKAREMLEQDLYSEVFDQVFSVFKPEQSMYWSDPASK